ncbi:MAG: 3-deoxy-manno-octulosonate cytidylyltransferase [Acidobacteria bacterium]|nr:3-deoxy-manno-octulosonate cytidylyltransferase [Acidobacteriota bacterium]MBI3656609.1 3-deoxy-manno-octulosonate cytidylyltransferase [Acidobacteriota bacterium]
MKCIAVIPARFASSRLPGKPLCDIAGKPMIQRVYERATLCQGIDRVLVATDDERIMAVVRRFGGEAIMTSPAHASGSTRMAEVAEHCPADIFVNVQGDEPLIDPRTVEATIAALQADTDAVVATAKVPITDIESILSPHIVKVVTDRNQHALYFSRWPIPFQQFPRADLAAMINRINTRSEPADVYYKHLGLYSFRYDFLRKFPQLTPTPLEKAEQLEQLRILEHGYTIHVAQVATDSLSVDTEEDLVRVRQRLKDGP